MPNMLPDTSGSAAVDDGIIKWGDLVVVHESIHVMKSAYMSKGQIYNSKFGHFKHEDMVGRPFGSKVYSDQGSKGFVFLLQPSPDLWSLVLKHRTQILYIADCSLISFYLELAPGSIVLETGTGSAALTHALARAVAPTGHIHTFEFHEARSGAAVVGARRELGLHGMGKVVTVGHRNIMDLGFPKELEEKGDADGVFLDLPGPWKVVESAAKCLRPDGKFCSFSPCIEQVQRTCEEMEKNGFTDITTVEVLLRVHEVRSEQLVKVAPPPQPPSAAPIPPAQDAGTAPDAAASADGEIVEAAAGSASLTNAEVSDVSAVTDVGAATDAGAATEAAEAPAALEAAGAAEVTEGVKAAEGVEEAGVSKMEVDKVERPAEEKGVAQGEGGEKGQAPWEKRGKAFWAEKDKKRKLDQQEGEVIMVTSKPSMEARGHTGYLTFGRKFVVPEKKEVFPEKIEASA
eukprot:gene11684-34407_t